MCLVKNRYFNYKQQLTNYSTSQPINQSTNQPINQSTIALLCIMVISFVSFKEMPSKGESIYMMYCVGCHAAQLEGTASAPSLLKQVWKNGTGREAIFKAIRDGFPNTIMIGWRSVLTDKDLDLITDFVVNAQQSTIDTTGRIRRNR